MYNLNVMKFKFMLSVFVVNFSNEMLRYLINKEIIYNKKE